jgi:hypothetical protein
MRSLAIGAKRSLDTADITTTSAATVSAAMWTVLGGVSAPR